MSHSVVANESDYPASPAAPRSAVHTCSKRARTLKLELSTRYRAKREALGLVMRDVNDRPQLVRAWENPSEPHAPNLLHIVEQGSDPVSRPLALDALEWAREKIESADQPDPRQLSIFDLLAVDR
jgi:hypothetical protein